MGGDRAMQGHVTAHASQLTHALWPTVTAAPDGINRARKGVGAAYSSVLLPPAAEILSRAEPENAWALT